MDHKKYIGYNLFEFAVRKRFSKGPFNNYVDKIREGRGQKMSVFAHAQGIKRGAVEKW